MGFSEEKLHATPCGGGLFVFADKAHDRLAMLNFDGTGPWIFAKRPGRGSSRNRLAGIDTKLSLVPGAS